jgi:hypothetical protein
MRVVVDEDEGKDVRRPGLQEEERRKGQVSQRRRCDGLLTMSHVCDSVSDLTAAEKRRQRRFAHLPRKDCIEAPSSIRPTPLSLMQRS